MESSEPTRADNSIRPLLIAAALAVSVVVVYAPVLGPDVAFVRWDDGISVVNNPHIRGLSWQNIRWMFSDAHWTMRYSPLSWLNWAIRYQLFGLSARAFHAGGVVLHATNAILLFLLIRALLTRLEGMRWIADRQRDLASAAAAALWALHPLRVETVAWVTHEQFALAMFFALAAANVYVRAGGMRDPRYWCAVLLVWAAALAHPIAMPLPAVLLVADWYPLRRLAHLGAASRFLRLATEKIPMALAPLLVAGMTLAARAAPQRAIWKPPPTLSEFDLPHRAAQALYMWACYLWRPFVPFDLSPVYTTLLDFSPWEPRFLLSGLLLVLLGALSIALRRRVPGLLALLACHFLVLTPVTGFAEHPHSPSDRYSYVQGAVMAVGFGWLIAFACLRRPGFGRAVAIAVAVVALGLGMLSYRLGSIWRGSIPLFEHILAQLHGHPHSADIHWRLGEAYLEQKRYDEALRCADQSLSADANMFRALLLKGAAELRLGHAAEAVAALQRATAVNDSDSTAQRALGMALLSADRPDAAEAALRRSIALLSNDPETHWWLGQALLRKGDRDGARAAYTRALELAPDFRRARESLAKLDAGGRLY